VSRRNKPSEVENKKRAFRLYLGPELGDLRLSEVTPARIAELRATLVEKGLKDKTVNNILAPLSKALRSAEEAQVVDRAPRVRLFKVERPEIECWTFDEYGQILAAAWAESPFLHVAALLAGDAGLRVGEIRTLDWERDVDLGAGTVTIHAQIWKGFVGTPKGRTRRTVPMTQRLRHSLERLARTAAATSSPTRTGQPCAMRRRATRPTASAGGRSSRSEAATFSVTPSAPTPHSSA